MNNSPYTKKKKGWGKTTREKNAPNFSYKVYTDFLDLVHLTPTPAIPKHVCCQRILGIAVPVHLEGPTLW